MKESYDIAIIGAGVIGCAIARELARYDASVCVIEKEEDVCCGTSKANSAIIHAGFDAKPGTLKAKLNVSGNAMMDTLAEELDIPFVRNGSLVVRTGEQSHEELTALYDRGLLNGVPDLTLLDRKALLAIEPNLADHVEEGLLAPTGGIVCPFEMTIALAENACENGVDFLLQTELLSLAKEKDDGFSLQCIRRSLKEDRMQEETLLLHAKAVINAAGVYSARVNNMVSSRKLQITPRKGEYLLLDKTAGGHVSHTVFQLPSKMGKGVLVTPTVHGNLLVGPTAVDTENAEETATSREGLEGLPLQAAWSVKNVPVRQVITSFAGLRAHEQTGDFIIGEAEDVPGFYNAAGIESPGLSSAPAIGRMLASMAAEKLLLSRKEDFVPVRKGVLDPRTLSMEERNRLIREKPEYGQIICRCEMITEGEIIDAIRRPLGARSLDGVKRRTRAGMGRCQAGFCTPRTMEILQRECGLSAGEITKNGMGSVLVIGNNKEI